MEGKDHILPNEKIREISQAPGCPGELNLERECDGDWLEWLRLYWIWTFEEQGP